MKQWTVALFAILSVGCMKQPIANRTPAPDNDPYALLSFNLAYTTLLNNDTAAISRCTVEELHTGNDRGSTCKEACSTGNLLIKFEQDNYALMQRTSNKPSRQHKWCAQDKMLGQWKKAGSKKPRPFGMPKNY
jgi:hypothetical protein